ncbi:MAG TPA: tetratricopeptide repeat protein [Polyangiaceae bacterium]|nr:tetratricopeptide repeat protein [Polyangiaceae bacterium]
MRGHVSCLLLAALLVTVSASAEEPAKPESKEATTDSADGVRRDPKGVQGVSPMWEAIGKGDSAVLARDYEAAVAAYREAITKNPQNALAHYRMGEAELLKGDLKEAQAAYEAALRFAGKDKGLTAKALFRLADLNERAKNWDQALARWNAYSEFAKTAESVKTFPATAEERRKRVTEWKQIQSDSAAVKERIEKRAKEAEETAKKAPITK